jgi:adenylate cyclase
MVSRGEKKMARRLAAILAYDVVGYSLAMGRDEASTLEALKSNRSSIIDPQAAQHGGRTIKLMGDGGLLEFASAVDALRFAVVMQRALVERNQGRPDALSLVYRIGINIGDVVVDGDDIYGDGVNIASRLEGLAEPGGISVHQSVREQARGKLDLDFEDLGEVEVKNIEQPVRAFHVILNEKSAALAASSAVTPKAPKRKSRTWLAVTAGLVLLVISGGALWWQPWATEFAPVKAAEMAQPLPTKPSIAVLALDDLSNGDNQGYLSDAISEGIITELSRFSEFFVIARNSSFKYRDKARDVRDIASELGVHYVLEGSQQKSGERLRITVQLIDALAGNHIWAETYDRDLADLFAVQDEIVRAVASSVGAEIAFRPPPSGDLARVSALQYHLKARQFIRQFTREGTEQARLLNLKAIEADPTSPFGYIGLTFVYVREHSTGWGELDPEAALARAVESAEKAMELDPENYDVYYARAWVHVHAGEQDQAIARYKQAIALNPSASNVIASSAEPLVYVGRVEEAIELLHRAMRLDPNHPDWFYWTLAWAQWHVNECEAALATIQSMAKTPNWARRTLATIYVCLGRQEEAEATIAKFLESAPGYTVAKTRKKIEKRYDDPADMERLLDALRGAGLPE